MNDYDWSWHPITRIVAALLAFFILATMIGGMVPLVHCLLDGHWRCATALVVVPCALWFIRLLLIGAWTGEEPPVNFDED